MQSLVATRDFPYAGRTMRAGQVFEPASDQDARLLIFAGHAEHVTTPLADPVDAQESEPTSVPPTRPYRRRLKVERLED